MKNLIPILFIVGIVAIAITIGVLSSLREKKRTAALQAMADSLGLPFYPTGNSSLVPTLSQFNLFSQGGGKTAYNMIHGDTEDVDLAIFDYAFTTGSGKHRHTHRQSVLYFDSPLLSLCDFAARPESFFHKLGKIVGLKDINFDTHPRFSSMYWLQGSNESEVRTLFRTEVLKWFEARSNVSAEGRGTRLIVYRADQRTTPDQIRKFMEEGFELYGLLRGEKKP